MYLLMVIHRQISVLILTRMKGQNVMCWGQSTNKFIQNIMCWGQSINKFEINQSLVTHKEVSFGTKLS